MLMILSFFCIVCAMSCISSNASIFSMHCWKYIKRRRSLPLVLLLQHCWLGDGKGIRPIKSWVLVCWWWRFDWSFARLIAPFVTTTSIILSFNKSANPGSPGVMTLKTERMNASRRSNGRILNGKTEFLWTGPSASWKNLSILQCRPLLMINSHSHWLAHFGTEKLKKN